MPSSAANALPTRPAPPVLRNVCARPARAAVQRRLVQVLGHRACLGSARVSGCTLRNAAHVCTALPLARSCHGRTQRHQCAQCPPSVKTQRIGSLQGSAVQATCALAVRRYPAAVRTRQDDGRHHGRELARERQPQHAADRAGQAQLGKLAHKLRRPFSGLVRVLKQRVDNPHGTQPRLDAWPQCCAGVQAVQAHELLAFGVLQPSPPEDVLSQLHQQPDMRQPWAMPPARTLTRVVSGPA